MEHQIRISQIEWREVELDKATNIIMGQSPPGESYNEGGVGTPFFQGKAEFTDKYPVVKKWTSKPAKFSEPNNILISVRAPVGDVNICNIRCCIGRGLASIKPKENIYLAYLFYYLSMYKNKIADLGTGSTFKAINARQLASIKIPLPFRDGKPELKEQERIVSILEKAEKLKEKNKNSDALLDEYLKSVFNEMFGNPVLNNKNWDQAILEKLCSKITDGEHVTPVLIEKGIPYISAKNVNEFIDFDNVKYVSEETYKKITKRCLPEYGDILITCVGTIGRTKRIDISNKFVFARSIALIKPTKINNIFLEKMLSLPCMKEYMIGNTNEATVKGLYLRQINNLKIICPPSPLQQKFADIVQKVEKMKENLKKTKANEEELFNSLMQKAFRGEL